MFYSLHIVYIYISIYDPVSLGPPSPPLWWRVYIVYYGRMYIVYICDVYGVYVWCLMYILWICCILYMQCMYAVYRSLPPVVWGGGPESLSPTPPYHWGGGAGHDFFHGSLKDIEKNRCLFGAPGLGGRRWTGSAPGHNFNKPLRFLGETRSGP